MHQPVIHTPSSWCFFRFGLADRYCSDRGKPYNVESVFHRQANSWQSNWLQKHPLEEPLHIQA